MLNTHSHTLPSYIKHYLESLKITAPIGSFEFVEQLQKQHLATYSFSSINAMQGKYLNLDAAPLFERLIATRQGGYCFEHNRVMFLTLEALGYEVRPALARVMLNGKTDNPCTHRVTLLSFAGKTYSIDVGFGVKAPIMPIAIDQDQTLSQGPNCYQVTRTASHATIAMTKPEPLGLYQIDLAQVFEGDCEVGHFYSHQHPEAAFVNNLVVSRIDKGQRYLIRNLHFNHLNEHTNEQVDITITQPDQLERLLKDYFNIEAQSASLHFAFEKIISRFAQQAS